MNPATGKDFEQHFVNQLGEGMPVFSGPRTQRGYGLGHVLRHMGKSAVPIIKHAGKEAIKRGIETVVEDLTGSKPKRTRKVKTATPLYAR